MWTPLARSVNALQDRLMSNDRYVMAAAGTQPDSAGEIAVPDNAADPISGGGFIKGINRIPQICGIPGNILMRGQTYTAVSC